MKYQELREWATSIAKKSNAALMEMGLKDDKKYTKIRSICKEGISVRCSLIINNTEKNNKYTGEIEEYIRQLGTLGLNPTKDLEIKDPKVKDYTKDYTKDYSAK